MQEQAKTSFAHKAICGASALALAGGLTVFPVGISQARADSVDVNGYITAASYRAAEPAPEILGLSNVGTNTAWQGVGELTWSAPYYYIFGMSEYNSNPNPYMVNAVNDGTPTMVYYQRQGGPMAAMFTYGSGKTGADDVWNMKPDIILGTGNDNSSADVYQSDEYKDTLLAVDPSGEYSPVGVTYNRQNVYTMIDTMYNLAAAADKVDADNADKTLRYGNATEIAKKYEKYVRGTLGYVLMQLEGAGSAKKSVALVNNYDAASNTYTIIQTGVAEGTATQNRYLEAVQPVATNIADSKDVNEDGYATVTPDELAAVDLILLGSQTGSEDITSTEDILNAFTEDMRAKTYWVSSDNGSAGSTYGVVMNSVENAQNIGRILGCLYSDYINQSSWIAYYYNNFYHIADGKLATTIDNAMDGVRNINANDTGDITSMTAWSESDVANYVEEDVDRALSQGIVYLNTKGDSVDEFLRPTSNLSDVSVTPSMHRLYNPNSGEHFYTASDAEFNNLVSLGWSNEDYGWIAPAYSSTPVYRMYNPNAGEHHYTMKADERDNLIAAGWNFEGVGWYSDDAQTVTLLREYNPNAYANNHNYTTNQEEHNNLVSLGWHDEGTAWYAVSAG